MRDVMKICEELKGMTTTQAIVYLRENKNNQKLQYILDFVYNPFVVSGISESKIHKEPAYPASEKFDSFMSVLRYIKANNTGTDKVLANIAAYKNGKSEDARLFIDKVITKTLRIGMNATSINKAFGKTFIPVFHVQLAEVYERNIEYLQGKEFAITEKLDGVRCMLVKYGRNVNLYARSGRTIEGCADIIAAAKNCARNDFVLDGELTCAKKSGNAMEQFRKTMAIVGSKGKKSDLQFNVFDYIDYKEYIEQASTLNYKKRRDKLETIVGGMNSRWVQAVPVLYMGMDTSVITPMFLDIINKGKEGLMLNVMSATYEYKRTKNLLKVKMQNVGEYKVIEIKQGTGKYEGMAGALVVDYNGYKLGVGSGLSDALRKAIWLRSGDYLGRYAVVEYNVPSTNADGEESVRHSRFVAFRDEIDM